MGYPPKKARKIDLPGKTHLCGIFFHPDCTVGTGIKPVQLSLAGYTAGGEFRPALKIVMDFSTKIAETAPVVKTENLC